MKVIIVDDDEQIVKMLEVYLKKRGYDIVGKASNGKEAIEIANTLNFDSAIIDFALPDISGYRVALKIREVKKDAKILIITGEDIELSEFPVLKKPFKKLEEIIRYLGG